MSRHAYAPQEPAARPRLDSVSPIWFLVIHPQTLWISRCLPHSMQIAARCENGAPAARTVGMQPITATNPAANHILRLRDAQAFTAKTIASAIPTSRAAANGPNCTAANAASPQTVIALNKAPSENRHPPRVAALVVSICALIEAMVLPAGNTFRC